MITKPDGFSLVDSNPLYPLWLTLSSCSLYHSHPWKWLVSFSPLECLVACIILTLGMSTNCCYNVMSCLASAYAKPTNQAAHRWKINKGYA